MQIKNKLLLLFHLVLISSHIWSQEKQEKFPYHLDTKIEIITISSALALHLSYTTLKNNDYVDVLSEYELNNLDANQINSFDRIATEYWSPIHSDYSSYIKNTLRYGPILFTIPYLKSKSWKNIITLGLIYAEGYYIKKGSTGLTKILTQRERPYLYNTSEISENEKNQLSQEDKSYFSFFSGHSSSVFYTATFISKVYFDTYGANEWFYGITFVSYSAATAVAYLRVRSGNHFPTDVIVGAAVGTAIGYFIPELHKNKNRNLSIYFPTNNQIGLIYQF